MWEQIRSNRRKSALLVVAMAILLCLLGFVIAEAIVPGAGPIGLVVAAGIWLILTGVAYLGGGDILMSVSGARRVEKGDMPKLINVVEEMQIAAGLPQRPAVYVIDDLSPNAFAAGRDPGHACIAVTTGLLSKLNRDQLQGVIAHEMSHIVNRDVLLMTLMGVMLGTIVLMSDLFLRGMRTGGTGRRRSGRGGGQGQAVMLIIALVLAVLAPLLARLIYFAASRRREYLADANAAALTRYPEGLAQALEAIAADPRPLVAANRVTAPMYICTPIKKLEGVAGLFSTHPPTGERVRILRGLVNGASPRDYQAAWQQVSGRSAGQLPASALAAAAPVALRAPDPAAAAPKHDQVRAAYRQTSDALRRSEGFRVIPCTCGVRIKLPPGFTQGLIRCPRCGATHRVEDAQSL